MKGRNGDYHGREKAGCCKRILRDKNKTISTTCWKVEKGKQKNAGHNTNAISLASKSLLKGYFFTRSRKNVYLG